MRVNTNKSLINEEGEKWVSIPGYEKYYKISNHGRIKRLVGVCAVKERILTWCWHRGYLMVTLSVNAVHNRIMVHIMVAKLFVDNPNNYPQVCHIDNNPSNPHWKNLKWGTQSRNIQDAHEQKRMGGEKHGMCILNEKKVKRIKEELSNGSRVCDLAIKYKIKRGTIYNIKKGKTWSFIKG